MMESGQLKKDMEKEDIYFPINHYMKDIGMKTKCKEKED